LPYSILSGRLFGDGYLFFFRSWGETPLRVAPSHRLWRKAPPPRLLFPFCSLVGEGVFRFEKNYVNFFILLVYSKHPSGGFLSPFSQSGWDGLGKIFRLAWPMLAVLPPFFPSLFPDCDQQEQDFFFSSGSENRGFLLLQRRSGPSFPPSVLGRRFALSCLSREFPLQNLRCSAKRPTGFPLFSSSPTFEGYFAGAVLSFPCHLIGRRTDFFSGFPLINTSGIPPLLRGRVSSPVMDLMRNSPSFILKTVGPPLPPVGRGFHLSGSIDE